MDTNSLINRLPIWRITKRSLAILGPLFFLYLAVGSYIFPEWYYTLIWEKGYADSSYWGYGLSYWTDYHQAWLVFGILVALTLIGLGYRYRVRLFSLLDRAGSWIVSWSVSGILIAMLTIRWLASSACIPQSQIYAVAQDITLKQIQSVAPPRTVPVPVDFYYLDADRATSLFNEIQPELVEKERTIGATGTVNGKLGTKVGPLEAEIGGSKENASNSKFQRLDFSPERKCVELMNYSLKEHDTRYFTEINEWLVRRQVTDFQVRYAEVQKRLLSVSSVGTTPNAPKSDDSSSSEAAAANQRVEEYRKELRSELASLNGLVFIEGDFKISKSPDGTVTMTEKFSEEPPILFRVSAPSAPGLTLIASSGRMRLRVFGTVARPLENTEPIIVRAIAVY